VCASTGATNARGSLRRRRRRRLFRSTTDFSRIFSRPLPTYYPLHRTFLHHFSNFVPCRRPFVVFLSSSSGFRYCHRTSGKLSQRLAAADGRLKITTTFLFFCFPRCRKTFSSGLNPTVCLERQHNSIPVK